MGSKNSRCMGTRISYNAYKDISIKSNLSAFMSSIAVRRFSIVTYDLCCCLARWETLFFVSQKLKGEEQQRDENLLFLRLKTSIIEFLFINANTQATVED